MTVLVHHLGLDTVRIEMHRRDGALSLLLRGRGRDGPATESESVQERKRASREQGDGEGSGIVKGQFSKTSRRPAVSEAAERKTLGSSRAAGSSSGELLHSL